MVIAQSNGNGVNGVNGHKKAGNESPIRPLRKSCKFYIPGGDLFILVEDTRFRVHSYFFTRESPKFQKALLETTLNGQLGASAANPLFLHNATSQQFEDFLWVFYNESFSIYDASVETWTSILGFANRWDFQQIRELAIRQLEALDLGLVERILIYQEQDVQRDLILPLYSELVTREAFITPEENLKLGDKTTVLILQARERLRASANNVKNGVNPLPNGVDLTHAIKVLESLLVGFPPTAPLEVSPSSPLTPKVTVSISM